MPLFTVRNKLSLGGARMAVKFTNFDEKPVKLQVRGKLLDSGGKIMLNDQPVARFESGVPQSMAGQPDKLEAVSKITVAPLGTSVRPIITLRHRCLPPACHQSMLPWSRPSLCACMTFPTRIECQGQRVTVGVERPRGDSIT